MKQGEAGSLRAVTLPGVNLLLIAAFGALGALSRYGVDNVVGGGRGDAFPWGTLTVNVAGAFALGVLIALTVERAGVDEGWRLALGVGFLSSFTTFSTYAYDTVRLAEHGLPLLAVLNVVALTTLGLLAAIAGLALGRGL